MESIQEVLAKFVVVIVNPLITLLFALALLLFFYGLLIFMNDISNGGEGKDGKQHMLWGIIGITIMFSVGGILNLLTNTVGIDPAVEVIDGFK